MIDADIWGDGMARERIDRGSLRWVSWLLGVSLVGSLAVSTTACSDDDDDGGVVVVDAGDDAAEDAGDGGADDDAFDGPSALIQLIHESPDPAAQVVDVYVNGDLFIDDFRYRTATPFTQVPAGTDLEVALAPGDSDSFDDRIVDFGGFTLEQGDEYAVVVDGVLDPQQFPSTPINGAAALSLSLLEEARAEPSDTGVAEATIYHGSPDTAAVAVIGDRDDTLVSGLGYGEFSNYVALSPGIHTLDVFNAVDDRRIDSFQTPNLNAGSAFVISASGFLNSQDSPLPNFGLFAYPAQGGEGIELMQAGRVQAIHNSADPALETVDVYLEGELIADDLSYREATPFVTFPAEVSLDLAIAPADSTSADDAIFTATPTLGTGGSYAAVANGVGEPGDFESNPDDLDTTFDVDLGVVREFADDADEVQLKAFHGVTDAPTIDLVTAAGKQTLVDDLAFGEFSNFFVADPAPVGLQVTSADDLDDVITEIDVDLSPFEGQALTLVASGFLTPGDQDPAGDADNFEFAILAVQADGSVAVLKPSP
jgi:hypothetical protein